MSAGMIPPKVPSRYKIERQLGQGAVGDVFVALDCETNQKVVIKALNPVLAFSEKNKIINADFRVSDMSKAESFINTCDLIMADPPRSGLDGKVKNSICGSAAKKIIYVSCDASSWARDAAFFNSCGFKLESLAFIDMFPGTYHIELISSFSR